MSSSAPPAQATVFTVDTLLHYMGNDARALATVAKIVQDGIAPGTAQLALAAAAIDGGRYPEARAVLHGLRGSIGTLGAQRFVTAALALEQAMAEQRDADVAPLFHTVKTELDALLAAARGWLAQDAVQATLG